MHGQYRLRQLTAVDWLSYKNIRLQAITTDPEIFGSQFDVEAHYGSQHWKTLLTDPDRAYFGLFWDDALVGMTGIIIDPRDAQRCMLIASFIKPAHRGKGLSGLFYKGRLDWARRRNAAQVIVSHRCSNKASRAAIVKYGFIQTHSEPKKWPDGIIADEHFYKLDLS